MNTNEKQQILNIVQSPSATVEVVLHAQRGGRTPIDQCLRLQMETSLAADFKQFAARFAEGLRDHWEVIEYDPGYDPHENQCVRVDLAGEEANAARAFRDRCSDPVSIAFMQAPSDLFLDNLKLYAVIVQSGDEAALFINKFKPSMRLQRRGGLHLLLSGSTFSRLESEVLRFEDGFDCCIYGDHALVHWQGLSDFLAMFDYYDSYREAIHSVIETFGATLPIQNIDEFRDAAAGDPRLMRMIMSAEANAQRFANVPIEEIQRVSEEYGYPGLVVRDPDDGLLKLVWNRSPSGRWHLPKLLNDSFVTSSLFSDNSYVAHSKQRVQRRTTGK